MTWCCACPTTSAGAGLARTLIDTPGGRVPLSSIATVQETDGPNQIGRENGRRRIVVYANTDGRDMGAVIAQVRAVVAQQTLPRGTFITLEASPRRRSRPRA